MLCWLGGLFEYRVKVILGTASPTGFQELLELRIFSWALLIWHDFILTPSHIR